MKNWKVEKVDKELVKNIVSDTGIPSITAMLMSIRGITAPEEAERFLYRIKHCPTCSHRDYSNIKGAKGPLNRAPYSRQ